MYFGSVKFFKHLIIAVILLAILIPTGISIGLSLGVKEKEKEISQLEAKISEAESSAAIGYDTAETLFELYKTLEDKEGFLKLLSEYDSGLYEKFVKNIPASGGTIEAKTEKTTASPEDESAPTEEKSPYADLYPELYCDTAADIVYDQDENYVYLTFDDGPSQYTENILYYLDKYDIKATFFVVPSGSEECNKLLKRIADAGHTIGIHSASHVYNDIYASTEAYLEDFKICYDRIYEATGIKCRLFRFPGGSKNDFNGETRDEIIAEMERRGFVYFDWNVDSNDAGGADWTEMYLNVLGQTADVKRAVVLMHDHNNGLNTVLVLEDIIKALLDDPRGYKFGKLTDTVKPVQF